MRLIIPLVLAVTVAAAILGVGWTHAERQRRMLGYEPMPAHVKSAQTARHPVGAYMPRVVYRYQRGREVMEGGRYMPLSAHGSLVWAQRAVDRYQPGDAVTVFVDPRQPARSYLVAEARFYPYVLMLAPIAALALLAAGLARGGCFEPQPRAHRDGPFDWYHIPAGALTASKSAASALGVAAWYGYGGFALGHYLMVGSFALEQTPAVIVFIAYALAGLPLVASLIRHRRLGRLLADASLAATLPSFRADGVVNLRIAQRVLEDVEIDDAALSLVCTQRRSPFHCERMFVHSQDLASDTLLRRGQQLVAEGRFEIPPRKRRPSSHVSRWHYPRTDWFVEVNIRLARGGHRRVAYPIRVEADQKAA